ncbi:MULTISPECIES: HmuY family protein [Sphingobacterium]|uniref:HmuY family protein n=1 Tax=Sphingobacterium TaxID=28453 RepID=UPI00104B5E0F|nr:MULTISPECIES: HmuY family protein [Sphingobacterium]MBB2953476.1 hypothetical protein [Sphingobacterium sp. JUb56]MCW2262879.1 hypothetical protein [Sphingobacterium kitahiroshimense]NJI73826.1 hypothetical protein [Sphingobacterium sp. B16(2022)]TCR12129.1 heme-binding HmuY-like protein [Sphingobacterium sp. JUb78]
MNTIKLIIAECSILISFSKIGRCIFYTVIVLLIASCGKDKEYNIVLEDGKSIVIKDLPGDTDASMGDGTEGKEKRNFYTFLFRFKDQKQIWIKTKADSAQWLKTKDWDLAFTGPYNSEVFVNNSQYQYNPGYQGEANNTAVILLKQPYQSIALAPSDDEFNKSEVNKIGWASSEGSDGWFRYSLNNHIMQALPNRTYVIRLPDGKYAKLQLINAYKGNPSAVTNMNWPAPYYTFKYYVQEDGSKALNTNTL